MTKYNVDVSFNHPDYAWFNVEADNAEDAEFEALKLCKQNYPEASLIVVDNIEESIA